MVLWTPRAVLGEPPLGHRDHNRFAIVASPRTGSNFLYSGLKNSPQVNIYHEILGPQHRKVGKGFDQRISALYRRQKKNVRSVGLKLFYNHLTDREWQIFHDMPDFQLIHLTRENLLRRAISFELALANNQWTQQSGRANHQQNSVRIDTDKLMARLDEQVLREETFRSRFSDRTLLEVSYEQLTSRPDSEFRRIANFLQLDTIDAGAIGLKKQNAGQLSELVENYSQVEKLLRPTSYSRFLES